MLFNGFLSRVKTSKLIQTMTIEQKKEDGFAGQMAYVLPVEKIQFCNTDLFCRNLYITDIGYYPNAKFHSRERLNGCAQYILIYCQKGKGWFSIANKIQVINSSDFIVIPPNTPHAYGADMENPWSIYWVHFTGDLADYYYNQLSYNNTFTPQKAGLHTNRILLFDDIMQHLELMNNNENIIYSNSCLYAFLATFQTSHGFWAEPQNDPIQLCINYMKENLEYNLQLSDFVKISKLSQSHLLSEFKKKVKYSPMQLFTSLKIQKACMMLMERKYSVKVIALKLGYDDQYHFSRVFKNYMGVSPKNFKMDKNES